MTPADKARVWRRAMAESPHQGALLEALDLLEDELRAQGIDPTAQPRDLRAEALELEDANQSDLDAYYSDSDPPRTVGEAADLAAKQTKRDNRRRT